MVAKTPQLNQVWNGKTLVNADNTINQVYTNMGITKLFSTKLSFFDFILKGTIAYNPDGLVRAVHGFTYTGMRSPIAPNTHLLTKYYPTPGKKNYKITAHYKFRTTISEKLADTADIVDYAEIISQQIMGVHVGEQQLMQYIFLKMFVSDADIKLLGKCGTTDDDTCCSLIPAAIALYEPSDGSSKGYGQYQNFRTLEEVAGNWTNGSTFKDFGVKSSSDLKPEPKLVKSNPLKDGLEVIRTALQKNTMTCTELDKSVFKRVTDVGGRKIIAMFLTAVDMRDDMCGPIATGKFTIGTTCLTDGKCAGDACACCLPSNFTKDEIVILASTADYRKYRDFVISDAAYSGVSGDFESMLAENNIYHDARLSAGQIYVLHKEAINIWITKTESDSELYKEHSIINRWFDRDMYIGHWCFLPGYLIKKQS